MVFDFVVVGATGMQGRIVSRHLLKAGYSVLMCGRDEKRINHYLKEYKKSKFKYLDLENYKDIVETIKNSKSNIVINCAEGDWNFQVLKACTEAGVNSLDLGSEIPMTRKQFGLHNELVKKELIHITGCGSVPGIGNVMLAYASDEFDSIKDIQVGFSWNSNIKEFVVPFSIGSIVEEFTEPATNIKGGHFTKIRPMSSLIEDKDKFVGEEEEFFVRHPETYTFYKYFKHKGVKNIKFYAGFPPHSFKMIDAIIKLGLSSEKPINFRGRKIKPIEFLTEVLKDLKIPKGYTEKEDLWVKIYGKYKGKNKKVMMQCVVPTLKDWEFAGCNIDTGMPASIMAQMIKNNIITKKGSFAPEACVPPIPFFKELAKNKMIVLKNGRRIN